MILPSQSRKATTSHSKRTAIVRVSSETAIPTESSAPASALAPPASLDLIG